MTGVRLLETFSCSHRRSSRCCVYFMRAAVCLTAVAAPFASASARTVSTRSHGVDVVPGMSVTRIVAPRGFFAALDKAQGASFAHTSMIVPSFSRQTKLACSACHYAFPQLTPFGRQFKLNGYTLTGLSTIGEPTDTSGGLKLASMPPVAAMVVASVTRTNTAQPGTQNNTAAFPDQASIFVAGQLTANPAHSHSSRMRLRTARSASTMSISATRVMRRWGVGMCFSA